MTRLTPLPRLTARKAGIMGLTDANALEMETSLNECVYAAANRVSSRL